MASVAAPVRGQRTTDGLSVDDLRVALQGHLKRTGVLSSFKTQLRTVLLTHLLDNTSAGQPCDATLVDGMSREVKQRAQLGAGDEAKQPPNLFQRAIADAVVLDYLQQTGRTFSYSIFTSECEGSTGVDPMQLSAFASAFPEGKRVDEQLAQVLHLPHRTSNAPRSVAEQECAEAQQRFSVLEQIVVNLMDSSNSAGDTHESSRRKRSNRIEQRGVQTVGTQQREWESVEDLFHTTPLALADGPHIVRSDEGLDGANPKREQSRGSSGEGVAANRQGVEFLNPEAAWKAPLEIRLARVDAAFADAFARQQHSSRERVERELGKLKDALALEARQEMQRQVEKFKQTEIERVRAEYQQRCEAVIEASRREASDAKEVLQRAVERQKATLIERENDLNEGFRRLHDKERLLLAQLEEKEREVRQASATALEEREQRHRFRRQCEQLQDILREKMEDVQALIEKIGRLEAGKKRAQAEYIWELKLRVDEIEELKRTNAVLWRRLNDTRMQQNDRPPQEQAGQPPHVQADLGHLAPSAVSNQSSTTGRNDPAQREKWNYDDIQASAYRVPGYGYSAEGVPSQRSTSTLHKQHQQYQEELENMLYHSEDDRRRSANIHAVQPTDHRSLHETKSLVVAPASVAAPVSALSSTKTTTASPPQSRESIETAPPQMASTPQVGELKDSGEHQLQQQQQQQLQTEPSPVTREVGSRIAQDLSTQSTVSTSSSRGSKRTRSPQEKSEDQQTSLSTSKSTSSSPSEKSPQRTKEEEEQNEMKKKQEEKERADARQAVVEEEQSGRKTLEDEQQTAFSAIQWSEKNNLAQLETAKAQASKKSSRSSSSASSSSSSVSYEDDGWGGKRPKTRTSGGAGKNGGSAIDRFPLQPSQDERYAGGDVLFQRDSTTDSDKSADDLLFGGNADDDSDF